MEEVNGNSFQYTVRKPNKPLQPDQCQYDTGVSPLPAGEEHGQMQVVLMLLLFYQLI